MKIKILFNPKNLESMEKKEICHIAKIEAWEAMEKIDWRKVLGVMTLAGVDERYPKDKEGLASPIALRNALHEEMKRELDRLADNKDAMFGSCVYCGLVATINLRYTPTVFDFSLVTQIDKCFKR